MKQCSKCKQQLHELCFCESRTHGGGYYPSCRQCEKRDRLTKLEDHPLCFLCNTRPHMKACRYCYPCEREKKGKGEPKWISRRSGLDKCKVCGIRPRQSYHHYCFECKREYQNRTRAKKWSERYSNNPQGRKMAARAYATGLLQRGKIKRGLCVFCGDQGTEFHHYNYEPRTRSFVDVCVTCHDSLHRTRK